MALNIDENNNELDFEIAKSVGVHFNLSNNEMNEIIKEISCVVKKWRIIANEIGIPKTEQKLMERAFNRM